MLTVIARAEGVTGHAASWLERSLLVELVALAAGLVGVLPDRREPPLLQLMAVDATIPPIALLRSEAVTRRAVRERRELIGRMTRYGVPDLGARRVALRAHVHARRPKANLGGMTLLARNAFAFHMHQVSRGRAMRVPRRRYCARRELGQ